MFRTLQILFALSLATAGVVAADLDVETTDVWTFSGVAFLAGAAVHLLGDTGANSGKADPLVVIGVWIVSVVVAGAVAFQD